MQSSNEVIHKVIEGNYYDPLIAEKYQGEMPKSKP